ncbi:MAG TPA: thioredoxin family protein [Stellaceae bacterium]|nr:thioredoxin family protein [Stellaceae bacterium]
MEPHKIVSPEEWLVARKALLVKEKELTRAREALARQRRELPWVKIEKPYLFDGPNGKETLGDLFGGRSQLIIKHFMFGPGWKEGCVGCSFEVDHIVGALVHLEHHDVSYVAVSRAPFAEIEAFRRRMGWPIRWVSSAGCDFNVDFHVSFDKDAIAARDVYYNYDLRRVGIEELSGRSVFYRNAAGEVFHTYSSYGRGGEEQLGSYACLDITPKGRNETGPNRTLTDWVRHHDRYDGAGFVASTGRFVAAEAKESCCSPGGG